MSHFIRRTLSLKLTPSLPDTLSEPQQQLVDAVNVRPRSIAEVSQELYKTRPEIEERLQPRTAAHKTPRLFQPGASHFCLPGLRSSSFERSG